MKPHLAAALLIAALAPQAAIAQTAPIRPVVSTTMQRTCDSQVSVLVRMSNGQEIASPQPVVQTMTRNLRVKRAGTGYLFEQTSTDAATEAMLRFHLSEDGVVSDAELSGTAFRNVPQLNLSRAAYAWADDLPERLLVGRSFAVGDPYYPEELRRTLLARTIESMGMPLDVEGELTFKYEGETTYEGRPAWRFGGVTNVRSSGVFEGRQVSATVTTDAEILHDAETALVLRYHSDNTTKIEIDGRLLRIQTNSETYVCRVHPL